jgi:hypothetical protein
MAAATKPRTVRSASRDDPIRTGLLPARHDTVSAAMSLLAAPAPAGC